MVHRFSTNIIKLIAWKLKIIIICRRRKYIISGRWISNTSLMLRGQSAGPLPRGFAKRLRRSAKDNLRSAKALPSAMLGKGLPAKNCRASFVGRSAKPLPSANAAFGKEKRRSQPLAAMTSSLSSASSLALGKEQNIFLKKKFFAEHLQASPRQRANHYFWIFFVERLQ